MDIRIKRIYAPVAKDDGYRLLVDRLWPRGMTKEEARIDEWLKEAGPSTALRKWFGHEPRKYPGFRQRYKAELKALPELIAHIRDRAELGRVTLLYSAKDEQHNQALVLREVLLG